MKKILVLLVVILASCICEGSGPMDKYCTEQCTDWFQTPTVGYWHGNDYDWEKTRCLCMDIDFGSEHLFDFYEVK